MSWTAEDIKDLQIAGLSDDELSSVKSALSVWRDRLIKNYRRSMYYDTEQAFKDLGMTLPPQLKNAKFYLGWGTKAVRTPAMRSQFEVLRLPGSDDPFELGEILHANHFGLEFSQSVVSAYKHGVAFATVAKGDQGESPVQIQFHSAETSGALWDQRKRRLSLVVTISEIRDEEPTEFVAYFPDSVLTCKKVGGSWTSERYNNSIGRVLAVPVTNDPQLTRPFGRSRLTNAVMSLTDMAVRAYVRMEGNAEFYSSPQLAIEGIDPDAFEGVTEQRKFKLAMDRIIALTKDQDGDKPSIKQMQQATMTPHSDMLRTVAMAFSGETGIPPSGLGIIHDQPASAEAITASERYLLADVTYQNEMILKPAVVEIANLAVMVRDGLKEPHSDAWKLTAHFSDPEMRALSTKTDSVQKLASSIDVIAKHPVLMEQIFDSGQIARIQEDARNATPSAE